MINKRVKAKSDFDGKEITGKVVMIYNEAIASGTDSYVPITELLIRVKGGKIHSAKPRNVIEVLKKK